MELLVDVRLDDLTLYNSCRCGRATQQVARPSVVSVEDRGVVVDLQSKVDEVRIFR